MKGRSVCRQVHANSLLKDHPASRLAALVPHRHTVRYTSQMLLASPFHVAHAGCFRGSDVYVEATSQRVRPLTPVHLPEHVVSQGAGSAVDQRGQACCQRQREGSSMTRSRSAHALCVRAVMAMHTARRVNPIDDHFEICPMLRDVEPGAYDRFKCSGVCARLLSRRNLRCYRCAIWLSKTPFCFG